MCVLKVCSVSAISTSKPFNRWTEVLQTVELQNIEMGPDIELQKYVLVVVKGIQGAAKVRKHLCCVRGVLCNVKELDERTDSMEQMGRIKSMRKWKTNYDTQQNMAYIAVLLTRQA